MTARTDPLALIGETGHSLFHHEMPIARKGYGQQIRLWDQGVIFPSFFPVSLSLKIHTAVVELTNKFPNNDAAS